MLMMRFMMVVKKIRASDDVAARFGVWLVGILILHQDSRGPVSHI